MNNEVEELLRRAAARRAQVEAQMRAQAEARARGQQMPPPQQQQIPVAYSPQQQPVAYSPQQPPVAYGQARPTPPRMTSAPQSLSQQQAYSNPTMAQTIVA